MSITDESREHFPDSRRSLFDYRAILRRRSSFYRERLIAWRFDQMYNASNSPAKGRRFSYDSLRFKKVPGAPRLLLKHESIDHASPPDKSNTNATRYRQMGRPTRLNLSENKNINISLVGAPRLNLSATNEIEDSSPEGDSFIDGTQLVMNAVASTPNPRVEYSKRWLNYCSQSPINNISEMESRNSSENDSNQAAINQASFIVFRCRICYEEGSESEPLISPCHCKGTVGLLHKVCLERWLQVSQTLKCEICGYAYILKPKTNISTISKSSATQVIERIEFFREWIRTKLVQRNLATDVIFLLLLTPATCLGVYFCITSMITFASIDPYAWQVIALIALATTLIVVLFCWIILATRHHIAAYISHRQRRAEIIRDDIRRSSLEQRWRFSVYPRPRGSSVALHTITTQMEGHNEDIEMNRSNELSQLRSPQCALINVVSPNFTLNLYPLEEEAGTSLEDDNSDERSEESGIHV